MAVVLEIALPFFAIMAAGYAALRTGFFDRNLVMGLNAFVLYLALPCLLIGTLAAVPIVELFDWRLMLVLVAPSILLYLLTLTVSLALGRGRAAASLRSLAVVYGNWGYMGIPILLAAFGPEAVVVAVLATLFDNLVSIPATVAILETARGRRGLMAFAGAITRVGRNPIVVASATGLVLALVEIEPGGALGAFLAMLGAAATPCALFALGGSLVGVPFGVARVETSLVSLGRLIIHPLMVWFGAFHLFELASPIAEAAVVNAAMPIAATVFVLASSYDVYALRSSTQVLITHIIAVFTITALLYHFRG